MATRASHAHRQRHDWDAIAAFYCSLTAGKRSYGEVGRKFGVSEVSVGKHARAEGWDESARRVDGERRKELEKRLIPSLADRDADTIRVVQAARLRYARQLQDPSFRVTGADLANLIKIERLIEGETTERVDVTRRIEARLAGMPEPLLRDVLGMLMRGEDFDVETEADELAP